MIKVGDRVIHKKSSSVKGTVTRIVAKVRVDGLPHEMEYNIDNLLLENAPKEVVNRPGLYPVILDKKAFDEGVEDGRYGRLPRFQRAGVASSIEIQSYIEGYESIMGGDYIGSADD